MTDLIKLLEQGEEISEALKIGLAVKHMTSNAGKGRRGNHGEYTFYSEYCLLEYYRENIEVREG